MTYLHTRDQSQNNFPCEEFNKVYDNHKIISVAFVILTFCVETSIQNSLFFQRNIVFDSKQALNIIQVKAQTVKSCSVGCLQ